MCAALLAACGSDDDDTGVGRAAGARAGAALGEPRYPYPRAAVDRFVADCAASAVQRAVCACTIARLQRTLPYRDFAAADAATRAQQPLPARTRRLFDLAATACRDAQ